MYKKRGFTLVEILFVVLIAAAILVFAVPAYKRVQERTSYNAALGILLDINNQVTALERDLRMSTGYTKPVLASGSYIMKGDENWLGQAPSSDAEKAKPWNQYVMDKKGNQTNFSKAFMWALRTFYLKNIPDTKGYDFYILNGNPSDPTIGDCKVTGKTPVACMLKSGTIKDCYKGAVILADGSVQRIKGADCQD